MNTTIPSTEGPLKVRYIMGIDFKPFYSPVAMLDLGIKGGTFGRDNIPLLYDISGELNRKFRPTNKWGQPDYDSTRNYFNVVSDQTERSLGIGTVYKEKHPLGWFEWYCRFWYGEKSTADQMRVSQWMVGINTAWYYIKSGAGTDPNKLTDLTFLPLRRQQLLEWAVDPTLSPDSYGCGDIL